MVIGHLKSDHRLNRSYLKGFEGDQINILMAAAVFNFRKWMRVFLSLIKMGLFSRKMIDLMRPMVKFELAMAAH